MENCVEKLNGKSSEDFKILYLKGGFKKEEKTTAPPQNTRKTTQTKKKEKSTNKPKETRNSDQPFIQQEERKSTNENKVTQKSTTSNPYKLIEEKSTTGIGMLVGTFPGTNRQEQLAIIAEVFRIPIENNLINIEHINGNSWFTGYFENEKERTYCISKVKEVNKEILNLDASSEGNTIRIIQLEEIQPRNWNRKEKAETNKGETTVQILDIPEDFTTSRIKGAIKSYGTITKIQTQPGRRNQFKTATVKFTDLKIDLDYTWAIPMGDTMARIAPAQACEETFNQRNQFTARLYGIRQNCSATRIMSAVKHTNAKTIHIPTNSRTGRRRNFAIVGFQDANSLEKAITRHIYLFGSKTWWSTKDNTKALQKHLTKRNEMSYNTQSGSEHESDSDSEWSTDRSRKRSPYNPRNKEQESKKDRDSYREKEEESQDRQRRNKKKSKYESRNTETTNTLSSLEVALQEIAERLNKLEGKRTRGKVAYCS
jgi:hypothetical protein